MQDTVKRSYQLAHLKYPKIHAPRLTLNSLLESMVRAFRLYLLHYGVNGDRRVALIAGDAADMEMGWKVTDMLPRGSEGVCSTALCRYHLLACHIHCVSIQCSCDITISTEGLSVKNRTYSSRGAARGVILTPSYEHIYSK